MNDFGLEEPIEREHRDRAGELILAFMERHERETDDGKRDHYDELMEHTLAEFEHDTMMSALIALAVGTAKGIDPAGGSLLANTMRDMLAEPKEAPWLTR